MELDPTALSTAERYKLLTGCVNPRPIALVSSMSPAGLLNLAPFSFFNAAGPNPMTLIICPLNDGQGDPKDTLRNVATAEEGGTGELVVHVSVEAYLREMAAAAERLPYGESEFELAGLETTPSSVVAPPRIKRAPAGFECRTERVIRLAPGEPMGGNIVIARVVHAFIRDDLVDSAMHVDQARLGTIGRMGGPLYTRTREQFVFPRGREALSAPLPFEDDASPGAGRSWGDGENR